MSKPLTGLTLITLMCQELKRNGEFCTDSNIVNAIRNYGILPKTDNCLYEENA